MKSKKSVTLSVKRNDTLIEVFKPDVVLEIRYYNVKDKINNHSDLWTDEQDRQCIRYFVSYKSKEELSQEVLQNLQSFADDLQHHSGIEAKLEESRSSDGLHVLKINKVDYYFQVDNGSYDGWGKTVG